MYKRDITYENFDGVKVTDTLYFNLTRAEIVEMQVEYPGGYAEMLMQVVKDEDKAKMFAEFKKLILKAYGERVDDGKRFSKTEENRRAFEESAAFDEFFFEVCTKEEAAADFVKGVFPKDIMDKATAQMALGQPSPSAPTVSTGPPSPPVPPAA